MDIVQNTVDTQADERDIALRLHVDVGGPLIEGMRQHVVECGDDRLHRRVHLYGWAGKKFLVGYVDGCEPAIGELGLRGLEGGFEVVETFVDGHDVRA